MDSKSYSRNRIYNLLRNEHLKVGDVKDILLSYKKISQSIAMVIWVLIRLPRSRSKSTSLSIYFGDKKSKYAAYGLIIYILSVLVYILSFIYKHQIISLRGLQFSLLILVSFEPFIRGLRINIRKCIDPYQTPLFVGYLKNNKDPFRFFGLDGTLYQNI
jgi:hypothetical protein